MIKGDWIPGSKQVELQVNGVLQYFLTGSVTPLLLHKVITIIKT